MSYGLETLSPSESGISDFKECLKRLRDGHPAEAFVHIRQTLRSAPENPFYLSYTGLLTALAEEQFNDAEKLCRQALSLRRNHAQLYLNLAEVYQTAGRFQEAIEVLEKGFVSTGRDRAIRRTLEKLGRRRKPVLPFLDRSNMMNRILGTWRHRLMGPPRIANLTR